MSQSKLKVGVIVGSLRQASFSRKVARALIARSPDALDCQFIEIGDLPLYNEDLEEEPPAAWARFRSQVADAQALLFVTPEYNRSVPGGLKNATDVGSRPEGKNIFDGLPAAIVSVTPYKLGAFGANHALRQSFVYLNLRVMQQPEAYLGGAEALLGEDGDVPDPDSDAFLRNFMARFGDWAAVASAPGPTDFEAFMKAREAASNAYIVGDAGPLLSMGARHEPATFYPPSGDTITGAQAVSEAHAKGAQAFHPGGEGRFEVLQSGSSGALGFWTGLQHASVRMGDNPDLVSMALRTTEIFRFEEGAWTLVHRHADMGKSQS